MGWFSVSIADGAGARTIGGIVDETLIPGAVVSEVARRHGVAQTPLFTWRKLARTSGTADELEVEAKTGAAFGERSADRVAQRNGYRDRDWEARAGTFELRIPNPQRRADLGMAVLH